MTTRDYESRVVLLSAHLPSQDFDVVLRVVMPPG